MLRRHFPLDRFSRFCFDPSSISGEQRRELARHLSTDSRRCWSAVSDIAPGSVRSSRDPVAEALYHVSTPQSRAVLMADHLAAVEHVRRRPIGFAFLLVEEAFSLACAAGTPAPLEDDVFRIISKLRPRRRQRQHPDDLYAMAMAYLCRVRTSRGEIDAARVAWLLAERHRQDGTGDVRVRATVLEAHAALAAALGDARKAESFVDAALVVLESSQHALRRSELYGRLADIVIASGELERLSAILEQTGRLLKAVESSDPVSRARAIYKRAVFIARVSARLEPHGWRLGSALRGAAAELEEAGELFAAATDTTTQTLRLLCLSRLYTFFDAERAAVLFGEAQRRIQPEGRSCVDVAELEQTFGHLRTKPRRIEVEQAREAEESPREESICQANALSVTETADGSSSLAPKEVTTGRCRAPRRDAYEFPTRRDSR